MSTHTIDPFATKERREARARLEELNQLARDNWHNDAWRTEMAADLTETIYWGFQHENLLDLFTNVERVNLGDRVTVKEVRGLKAFWVARGGYIEESTLHAEVAEITWNTLGFHVYEFEDKIATNFGETQATLVDLGSRILDAAVNARVLGLFQAAVPSSSAYYTSGAGLALSSLNTALRQVADLQAAAPNINSGLAGTDLTIMGRRTMTDQIVDLLTASNGYTHFTPQTNEDLLRRGVLGTYRGAQIITLRNYVDDAGTSFFPANELWVIGRDASKFAFFGGLKANEWTEQEADYWHYRARQNFGGLVHRPERLRRIVDTSITP